MQRLFASPPPIRTDASNPFAHYSMAVRVPKILDDVIASHPEYPTAITAAVVELRNAIANNASLPTLAPPAPDAAFWSEGLARRAGSTWLDTDWFFVECFAYRCLLARTRYWETLRDPFAPAKGGELASARPWEALDRMVRHRELPPRERLGTILLSALWGNRVDLSYTVGTGFGAEGASKDLLLDDREWAVRVLLKDGGLRGDIHLLVDNSGSELLSDLVLVDALLDLTAERIILHVKMAPTFVSDATVEDVWALFSAMRRRGGESQDLAHRLESGFEEGRVRIAPDFYWNSAWFWDERPPHLARELDGAGFIIAKGDANYRRLIGDAIWPAGASLADVVGTAAPLLCLRALKCDAMVGLPEATVRRLDSEDAEWRINGRRGIIQGNGG